MYRVIVHERCRNHELLRLLTPSLNIIRFASTIKADFIFLDTHPSLGVVVESSSRVSGAVASVVDSITQLQSTFTHSCVVVYGDLTDDKMTTLQLAIPCGTVRIYAASTVGAAAEVTLMHVKLMTQTAKLDIQKQYFIAEAASAQSTATARDVLFEAHSFMGIPPLDTELIANHYPTHALIMAADHSRIHYQVPCDDTTARVLNNFFTANVHIHDKVE